MVLTDLGYYVLVCLIWVFIFAVFWAIAGFLLYRFVDRKLRACPNCKQRAAGMILRTEIDPLGSTIDHSGKETVQVNAEKVTDYFECKHCKHTWQRSYERKERIPLTEKR